MTHDWTRVRGLFEELLDLEPGLRSERLRAVRDEDETLGSEVAALLEAAVASEGELEPPSKVEVERRLQGRPPLAPGDRVGAYRVTRLIATGGMGSVYEAEQEQPRRKVALKVVHRGLNDRRTLRRFRVEAELLARLQHPSIARIFESGVHPLNVDGREQPWPFYAMEFVEDALPLDRFAAERGLDDEGKLRLFSGFCDAVHFGHQRGVIHRDLKPDNLLVGGDGLPKVIDFGVARVTDAGEDARTLLTQTGQVVGTLKYMSPEQVEANSESHDVRTDVYALGVVLYQLLTGALPQPVDDRPPLAVARAIRDDAPRRPTAVRPDLAADVESILLKALEKEPARRYASVAAFSADIERFLTHHPVEARGVSWTYHLRLFARRHRVLVTAGSTVFLIALGAAWVSLRYAAQANESRRIAERARGDALAAEYEALTERDSARAARDAARASRDAERSARQRADRLLRRSLQYAANFTTDIPGRLSTLPGGLGLARELLSGAIQQLEALEVEADTHPILQAAIAQAYFSLGDVQGHPFQPNLGDREGAAASYRKGLALAARLESGDAVPDEVSYETRYLAALGANKLGDLATDAGDDTGAERHYRDSLERFRALREERPEDPWVEARIPHVQSDRATALSRLGDEEGAWLILRDLPARMEALATRFPEDPLRRIHVVQTLHLVAAHALAVNQPEEALEATESARMYFEQHLRSERDDTRAHQLDAWNLQLGGLIRVRLAEFEEAEQHLLASGEIYTQLIEAAPEAPDNEVSLGDLHYSLGSLAHERAGAASGSERAHLLTEAEAWFRRSRADFGALEARERLPGKLADFRERIDAELEAIAAELDELRADS